MSTATLRRPPRSARRAFVGCAGSPLSRARAVAPSEKKIETPKATVLIHICFNQESGERKKEHCPCEERGTRVRREVADAYVHEKVADWLLVPNKRSKSGRGVFHRAIVVKQAVLDGKIFYKLPQSWAPTNSSDRRLRKHATLKKAIFEKVRDLLRRFAAQGWVSWKFAQMADEDIEILLKAPEQCEELFSQPKMKRDLLRAARWYWNVILGFYSLNVDQGIFMPDAASGKGLVLYKGAGSDTDIIDGAHETDTGRVKVANHKASFWSGGWDYSSGHDKDSDEAEDAEGFVAEGDGSTVGLDDANETETV